VINWPVTRLARIGPSHRRGSKLLFHNRGSGWRTPGGCPRRRATPPGLSTRRSIINGIAYRFLAAVTATSFAGAARSSQLRLTVAGRQNVCGNRQRPGPGDNQWWIRRSNQDRVGKGTANSIYQTEQQLALRAWSPDGGNRSRSLKDDERSRIARRRSLHDFCGRRPKRVKRTPGRKIR